MAVMGERPRTVGAQCEQRERERERESKAEQRPSLPAPGTLDARHRSSPDPLPPPSIPLASIPPRTPLPHTLCIHSQLPPPPRATRRPVRVRGRRDVRVCSAREVNCRGRAPPPPHVRRRSLPFPRPALDAAQHSAQVRTPPSPTSPRSSSPCHPRAHDGRPLRTGDVSHPLINAPRARRVCPSEPHTCHPPPVPRRLPQRSTSSLSPSPPRRSSILHYLRPLPVQMQIAAAPSSQLVRLQSSRPQEHATSTRAGNRSKHSATIPDLPHPLRRLFLISPQRRYSHVRPWGSMPSMFQPYPMPTRYPLPVQPLQTTPPRDGNASPPPPQSVTIRPRRALGILQLITDARASTHSRAPCPKPPRPTSRIGPKIQPNHERPTHRTSRNTPTPHASHNKTTAAAARSLQTFADASNSRRGLGRESLPINGRPRSALCFILVLRG
ncbi:hypothetical protein C8Q78DRAFT_850594 [Trametes maxima]|nr:hypothetical protein C8Q78DRAFT_850594 [Trametes maxima]